MSQLLDNLNPEQLAAVTLPPQHALILAGAGSGKTRVLTTRIAWLIQNGYCSPQGILAVTFTNKAAKEMLTRLSAMFPINTRGMWIGTFHGLCNRFLRAHHRDAGLPQLFQILDSGDQLASIKRLLKTLNVDDEKFPPREQHFINGQKEAGLRPAAVEAWDDYTRRRVELYMEYEAQCQREAVVDFPELLLRSYELLERNEPIRRHYQARFRHILVDEFQDTNRAPIPLAELLADGAGRAGRACSAWATTTSRSTASAAPRSATCATSSGISGWSVIRLEQNYRSHGNILDAANALIANNSKRLGKNLWTDRAPASRSACMRPSPTATRRAGSSRRSSRWCATAPAAPTSRCCTAPTPSRGCWSTSCSPAAWPTGCMAGCASSSARRSSTRWPTCA
jgi:DNA helicase-2/ATP-dependent DNA helicase PcrA